MRTFTHVCGIDDGFAVECGWLVSQTSQEVRLVRLSLLSNSASVAASRICTNASDAQGTRRWDLILSVTRHSVPNITVQTRKCTTM